MLLASNYLGNFNLKTDEATFRNKIVPWCYRTFGTTRGKKRAWIESEQPGALGMPYRCSINFKHNSDSIAFLAKWGELVGPSTRLSIRMKKPPEPQQLTASMADMLPALRWLHRNVPKNGWQVAMTPYGLRFHWDFYFTRDDYEMAFLMVRPTTATAE